MEDLCWHTIQMISILYLGFRLRGGFLNCCWMSLSFVSRFCPSVVCCFSWCALSNGNLEWVFSLRLVWFWVVDKQEDAYLECQICVLLVMVNFSFSLLSVTSTRYFNNRLLTTKSKFLYLDKELLAEWGWCSYPSIMLMLGCCYALEPADTFLGSTVRCNYSWSVYHQLRCSIPESSPTVGDKRLKLSMGSATFLVRTLDHSFSLILLN